MKVRRIKYGVVALLAAAALLASGVCGCSRPLELGLGSPDSSDDAGSTDTGSDTGSDTTTDTDTGTETPDDGGPDPDSGVTD